MVVHVGMLGCGMISRGHLADIAKVRKAAVTMVYDPVAERAQAAAEADGITAARSSDELLDSCDAVFVCTPTGAHRRIVEQATARGLAVFCEKPLAPTLADAQAIAEAVDSAGVINQVGLPLRRRPSFEVLRHLLANSENGHIVAVSMRSLSRGRSHILSGWRGDQSVAGGGMLIEVGFHDLDILQWLAGPVTRATGFLTRGARTGVEDAAAVSATLAHGGSATLLAAWDDAPVPGQSRQIHVVCDNAEYALHIDGSAQQLIADGPGDRHQEWDARALAYKATALGLETNPAAAFIQSIEQNAPAWPTIADALAVHVMLDQIYRSAIPPISPTEGSLQAAH